MQNRKFTLSVLPLGRQTKRLQWDASHHLDPPIDHDNNDEDNGHHTVVDDTSPAKSWIYEAARNAGEEVKSIDDLRNRGFDKDSASPDFYWHEHHLPGKGAQFLTAKAFQIENVDDVSQEEARFTLGSCKFTGVTLKQPKGTAGEDLTASRECTR